MRHRRDPGLARPRPLLPSPRDLALRRTRAQRVVRALGARPGGGAGAQRCVDALAAALGKRLVPLPLNKQKSRQWRAQILARPSSMSNGLLQYSDGSSPSLLRGHCHIRYSIRPATQPCSPACTMLTRAGRPFHSVFRGLVRGGEQAVDSLVLSSVCTSCA